MSDSSSPVKFRKPCGKRGPAPAADDLPPKIPKYIFCEKEMPPLSPAPSTPSPVKYTPVDYSLTLSSSTTWRTQEAGAAPAKPMTRSAWLLKLYAEGFPYANPFAQHMARLKVQSGLSCFPVRQPASAALAAVASAGFGQQLAPRPPQ